MVTIRLQIRQLTGAQFEVQVSRSATMREVIDEYIKVSGHVPRENY